MKIARVATDTGHRLAVLRTDNGVTRAELLAADHLRELFGGHDRANFVHLRSVHRSITDPVIVRLCDDATRLFCVGHNYRQHIQEMGRAIPEFPAVFAKLASATTGPYDDIALRSVSGSFDWEAELGVVVAAPLRDASEDEARQAIAGYTLINDVTARDWQGRTSQWFLGKNFDHTSPVGPALVTPDELPHDKYGNVDVEICCEVNGELRQSARTSDLVFTVPTLLSYLSRCISLRPGDVIATGTPGGVGAASNPPSFLQPGDAVVVRADGIGACVNRCRSDGHPITATEPSQTGASR
jgi:acylpyruvate hydrolase